MKLFTVGVTGTQSGMTVEQASSFEGYLEKLTLDGYRVNLVHGEAQGVDIQAADIAYDLGIATTTPDTQTGHFARNREIVDRCDLLIVIPWQDEWQPEGGTWYTHDYAKKQGVEVLVIWPSAEVHQLITQGR